MPDFSHSDFVAIGDHVDSTVQPITRQVERIEGKLDELSRALANLVLFEERQAGQAQHMRSLDSRIAAMAERFDGRLTTAETKVQALSQELHGHKQRVLGIAGAASAVCLMLGALWSVASKFIP